jgi:hypothetical protein
VLAVVKWKELYGVYHDCEQEHEPVLGDSP